MNNLLVSSGMIADGILVAIALIFVLVGVTKGFIKSVLSFFGSLVALIVAFIFCKQFAAFLNERFDLLSKLSKVVENWLDNNSKFAIEVSAEGLEGNLVAAGIPQFMISVIMQLDIVTQNTYAAGTTIATLVSPVIANYLMLFISFLGLFILFKIALLILKLFADSIKKIKVIDFIDKLLGFVVGAVEAAITIYLILTVIAFFPSVMSKPMEAVNSSTIAKYLYESDILGKALEMVVDKDKLNDAVDDIIGGDDTPEEEEEASSINFNISGIEYNFI